VFVVDDLSLPPDAIDSVRSALRRFVDEQMRPNDRAAMVRTAVGVSALETFTSDKSQVRAAVDQVKCWPPLSAGSPDERTRNGFGAGSRAALHFAVGGLRAVPGRKAVVVFSSNLALFRNALEAAGRLVNVANQAGAVLYGIDPNEKADPVSAASFMVLAEQTGGTVLESQGLSGALERVLGEQEGYYLIDYHPTATLALVDTEAVSVRVTREGLVVRSRTGSIGSPRDSNNIVQKTRRQQMLQALADPFSSADIRVRLTGIFVNSAQAGSEVEALAHINARDLGFIHFQNGRHRYGLDVAILACAEDGRIVQENSRSFYMDMSESDYRRAVANGLVFALNVPVRLPGPYQLRAIIGDGITGRIGFASQYLDVPDVSSKQFSISSIMILGEKSNNPMSRPPGVQLDVTNEDPAIRIFKPGQTFIYGYEVLNGTIGADNKPGLETQTRLLRNGRMIFEGSAAPVTLARGDDPKRTYCAGRMTLASSIEPGDYILWVTVADKLAPDQPRHVAQYADFRIEP